jgi:hypothetical protein
MWECKHCGWLREDEPKEAWGTCPDCDGRDWMRQGERNNIKWLTEPPTQEGMYQAYNEEVGVRWVDVAPDGIGDFLTAYAGGVPSRIGYYSHWLGPIPIADPPTEGKANDRR